MPNQAPVACEIPSVRVASTSTPKVIDNHRVGRPRRTPVRTEPRSLAGIRIAIERPLTPCAAVSQPFQPSSAHHEATAVVIGEEYQHLQRHVDLAGGDPAGQGVAPARGGVRHVCYPRFRYTDEQYTD